ncbi:flagellar hook-basal body complex protein FliE [Nitrosomonas sp. JL21]|uniref:flagellar hook-basal body complex protein FliE n=1 Tax=Nitrosomonas sp. JL21 TaxID=153949 RepID=UPI00136E19B7|nr:flagellar hook-basal body complex protein FliE [Nitrosomonas sp. JL21]MBL8497179.1 flagellar hook-basal body complex protein FliE [Nitrosomonas sp.]MCC7092111.1 flagellar hook-basal body complex protein FliE [Nitrosomonas sp.]MXS76649.1 flagellar hook-basal body complex protein FliE [Nitrosomonas sp. JL21]
MDKSGVENILQQLQAASALASGIKKQPNSDEISAIDFSEKLKAAINQTNNLQQNADHLSAQFVSSESNVDLHEVMISLQKANVSFQSMIQVRNKLVTAYQEIMNMQV